MLARRNGAPASGASPARGGRPALRAGRAGRHRHLPRPRTRRTAAGRLLREGLLQQSALSPSDAYCAPERTARLARLILDAVDDCLRLTERGTPAGEIEVRDFSDVLRAKERP
ncbi:hypothetical protein [Nonomuraea fuscirosea]|uniref:hypothetical protein n=1 Tax=Nonomuraea fuscirosea TaxID=1291556 RepID=UPI0033D774A5